MDFFISSAYAQDGGGETGMVGLLFPLLILVFFYFIFIRPQQKRAKEHKLMTEGLKKGDEISTSGGLPRNCDGNRRSFCCCADRR